MPFTNNTGRDLIAMIDREHQVLSLDIEPSSSPDVTATVWTTSANGRVSERSCRPCLFPSIASVPMARPFASVATFAAKAKAFDDGLYAAVEVLAEHGTNAMAGREDVVAYLVSALGDANRDGNSGGALEALAAARALGDPETPGREKTNVSILEKPIGFYTWSDDLRAIFRKGKLLQPPVREEEARALSAALERNRVLAASYGLHLALSASLTNPLVRPGLLPSPHVEGLDEAPAIYPASESHEGRLLKRLFGSQSVPSGFHLVEELADRVTSGKIDLRPTEASGWYDHQLFALEGLVVPDRMPEARHLQLSNEYRRHLRQVFVGVFGLTRETHIKQLELLDVGCIAGPDVVFRPTLTVEPMAEYYLRRAQSYRFVQRALVGLLGESALAAQPRLREGEPSELSLLEELEAMVALFAGAYLVCCEETGLVAATLPLDGEAHATAKKAAEEWVANQTQDPDLATDNRCMVPLFYDVERRKTKVLAILGYEAAALTVDFVERPDVKFRTRKGTVVSGLRIDWEPSHRRVVRPVVRECYVDEVLDRDEFRQVCDGHQTAPAILRAVGAPE